MNKLIRFFNNWFCRKKTVPDLHKLTLEERKIFIARLIKEQVVNQRSSLHFWRELTKQPAQIDTGYIAQHLVSLVTKIKGGGFRGKGFDLEDGSEVKSANFLDSLDAQGATAPRWNFTCNDVAQMEAFLKYPSIYLVSMDKSPQGNLRFKVWMVDTKQHQVLSKRYEEWMDKLGHPKLGGANRQAVNFQLFPPRNGSDDKYARHGNGREDGFDRLEVQLEGNPGSQLILHCEVEKGEVVFKHIIE